MHRTLFPRFAGVCFALLVLQLGTGCRTMQVKEVIVGPDFVPKNVFLKYPQLPPDLRKIAILPITGNEHNSFALHGREVLQPVVVTEAAKSGRFETVLITGEELRKWTGKEQWRADDELPPDFLQTLRQRTACDGVLFVNLLQYSPYPPLIVGWQMKLVKTTEAEVLWAADEVFDSSEPPVSNSARRYAKSHLKSNPVLEDTQSILIQPTRFGEFTAQVVFNTLPLR